MTVADREADRSADPDRHRRWKAALVGEVCRRILDDPALIDAGRAHMERFMAVDPYRAAYYALWKQVIDLPAPALCARILADTPEGEALRTSMPVFVVLPNDVRSRLVTGGSS